MRSVALQISILPVLVLFRPEPLLAGVLLAGAVGCVMSALRSPAA